MRCVLGVDGGNSKTDYLLHGLDGRLIAHVRAGTCSHEALGYPGACAEMDKQIAALLKRAGIARTDVEAAVFGLAGVDHAGQKAELTRIAQALGFGNCLVMNDSFLGIKAGSPSGIGVCSINGTGTASGGIDAQGGWVQVGGIGDVSGDEAGGGYIARRAMRAAYDAVYRFGEPTLLLEKMMALLGCDDTRNLHEFIGAQFVEHRKVDMLSIIRAVFDASDLGDAAAVRLVRTVADTLARNASGCVARLLFERVVPVVLIGSVWTKGRYQPMIDHFLDRFRQLSGHDAELFILDSPPASGSVLWAIELAKGSVPDPDVRTRVLSETRGL